MRSSPHLKGGFLYGVVALLMIAFATVPSLYESPLADAERVAFDTQMRLLREIHPRPLDADVVLVGIDDETEDKFADQPIALWHRYYAKAFHALAVGKARAVGVDIVLPARSFEHISRGIDMAMMRGMVDLKRSTPVVFVQTVNNHGELVAMQPNYEKIIEPENVGLDQHFRDPDSVSRVFSERLLSRTATPAPTLAGQILRGIGANVDEGYIDYSIGAPLEYVPLHRLVEWTGDAARLEKLFRGRVVLIGSLIRTTDRWRLPVKMLARDPGAALEAGGVVAGKLAYDQPGVLIHLQVLRSHLANGLLHPFPEWARWLAMAFAALAVLVSAGPFVIMAGAVLVPLVFVVLSATSIVAAQTLVPVASIIATFWIALIVRGVFDAVEAVVDRLRLQQSFAGQVSPAVMREMLGGNLSPGLSGQQAEVCVLFSDVRDFTTLTENMPPTVVTTVLQRYFDRMVHAVHRYDGTVDKFIGDGMMVLFGAPRKSKDPCGDAVQCALAMMKALDSLNEDFKREGLPTLVIGIGINFGTVTVGNIGSSERHNYSAIGDAVNVAARVEGLTKDLGRKIIITEAVVSRIEEGFHFDPLGSHNVKGHSPVTVWGIRTARAAPSLADTAEVLWKK
jgi:adenylate cyclase